MKLKQALIYGFGKWHHKTIHFQDEGLTVFYGKNEAGKSTLRQFILYVLFNLPPKKVKAYIPKMGGTVGGRLMISDVRYGTVYIERDYNQNNGEARCYFDDGSEQSEEWLRHYLKGMDKNTFEAIFSFDLHDIQHIHTVGSKAIGDVLFGVGMTGSKQIYQLETKLEKEIDRLFKKQGRKPVLNEQFAHVKEMEQTLSFLKQEEQKYEDLKLEEQEVQDELHQLQEKRQTYMVRKDLLEKHHQASHLIFRYQQLKEERSSLPETLQFPEQGLERYYKLKEQEMPIRSEKEVVKQELQREESKKGEVPPYDEEGVEELTEWIDHKQEYDINHARLEGLLAESGQEQERLAKKIEELGIHLTFEDVLELSLPFYMEEEWQRIGHEKETLEEERARLEQELRLNDEEQRQLQGQRNRVKGQMLSEDDEAQLRTSVERAREKEWKKEVEEEQSKNRRHMVHQQSNFANQIFLVGVFLSVIGAAGGWVLSEPFWFIFSAFLLLATWFIVRQLKQSSFNSKSNVPYNEEEQHTEEPIGYVWELERQLQEQDQKAQEVMRYEQSIQQCNMREIQIEEQLHSLKQRQERINQIIGEQTDHYPFLNQVSVSYWPKVYQRLSSVQLRQQEWLKKQEQIETLAARQKTIENQLILFADRLRIEREGEIESIWNDALEYVNKAEEHKRDLHKLDERLNNLRSQMKQLEQKQLPIQEELRQLYEKANVSNSDSFIKQGEQARLVEELEDELCQLKKQIDTIYMNQSTSSQAILSHIDEPSIKRDLAHATEDLENTESEIEGKRQQLADLRSNIQLLEKDERYSMKRHEVRLEKDKSKQIAKEWTVYKVAHSLLKQTKEVYQEERMPAVVEYCSHFFSILTRDTYIRVWLPGEEEMMTVERKDGVRFSVESLSQGTKEQLYVALRLALSQTIRDEHPLPFIIDDAFVNFDDERTCEVLELLQQIAQDQQVILFTCSDTINQKITERKKIFL
ncbi:AAA family ATPase [Pontibacillus sp. ALD_SL1]|uniref:ATP-binding protein n=1 Tax=Pontibacillus sp. ALD_SL1 TaxID=2777185 RepID=UPI001A977D13|nr:AAA family ATPase [Pontibacillus sp. ALD_SL1]QST00711.1 AAA family ATPase [Pontibacillus sp. ALD_SL1]